MNTADKTIKRLLIVAPGLADPKGHLLSYLRGIAIANVEAGIEVTVLSHTEFDVSWIPEATVIAYFERRWDEVFYFGPGGINRLVSCLKHNAWFFRRLRAFLAKNNRWDAVFCAHTNILEMIGLRFAFPFFSKESYLLINNPVPVWVFDYAQGTLRFKRQAPLVRAVYRSFAKLAKKGRCSFSAETEHDATVLSKWSGLPVKCLPTPKPALFLEAFASAQAGRKEQSGSNRKTRLAWLGRADTGKGFDLLLNALELFEKSPEAAQAIIVVQWFDAMGAEAAWRARLEQAQRRGLAVEWIEGALATAPYAGLLASIDFLLLPYKKVEYTGRNSSAALDAFCCGVPIITSRGTWMDEKMQIWGGGLTFKDGDAVDLCLAMQNAVHEREKIENVAKANAHKARNENSWARLMAILWPSSERHQI